MIIETLADIGTEVYFIKNGKIDGAPVASIDIEISHTGTIQINYRFTNTTTPNIVEENLALTQQGLFDKIKLKK